MKPVFERIAYVGIVVEDLEETMDNYSSKYGIGPWSIYDCDSSNVRDMSIGGMRIDYSFRSAHCSIGETGLELIQPLDDRSIYADFLKEKGQYLHHLGYRTADFSSATRFFREKGFAEYQRGNFYARDEFVYFDTREQLKHIIELNDPAEDFYGFENTADNISFPVKPVPRMVYPSPEKQKEMPLPVFGRIGQVAFIVKSVDEMVKRFNDEYGIGPWKIWEFGPDTVEDMTIHGKQDDYRMRLALAKVGNIDFELIQPRDDKSIYSDFLKSSGEGFHHLAYEVDDFYKLMEYTEKIGLKVSMSGVWCGKHTWAYMTTEDDLKHIVELNYTEPGFIYPDPVDHYPAR